MQVIDNKSIRRAEKAQRRKKRVVGDKRRMKLLPKYQEDAAPSAVGPLSPHAMLSC